MKSKIILYSKILIFASLIYFPLFLQLDILPLRTWDETRLALNAVGMLENGNYLIPHFQGNPDMWNTKPPLMIWLQVLFLKIIGINELAIRLPSALAGLFTCLLLFFLGLKYMKDYWWALITVVILVTSYGYINEHVTRTGDYDSLMIFFTTTYTLSFYAFLEKLNTKFLHLFFLAFTLAVLTKSIQGVLFIPPLIIYLFIQKKWFIFKNKWLWIDALLSMIVIFGYYGIREIYNPGYINAVWLNELGGRYLNTLENHKEDFFYYYDMIINNHYAEWYWMVPCGIVVGLFTRHEKIKKITIFSTIMVIGYWLIISMAQTKLYWYSAPMYPFLAILCASFFYTIFIFIKNLPQLNSLFVFNPLPYVLLFLIFLTPYEKIIDKVYCPQEYFWDVETYGISYLLKDQLKSPESNKKLNLCYKSYQVPLWFYIDQLKKKQVECTFADWKTLKQGDTVFVSELVIMKQIDSAYKTDEMKLAKNVKRYIILDTLPNKRMEIHID